MARRCEVCNKGVVSGTQYSHSHRQSKRTWAPNIKRVKALVNGTPKTVMYVQDALDLVRLKEQYSSNKKCNC